MFKEISQLIGDVIPQWLIYVFGGLLIVFYVIVYAIDKIGFRVSKEVYRRLFRKKGKLNKWKLKHHEFFEYITFLLDYKIKNISFEKTTRELILKDFLRSYIESLYDHHMGLIESKNIKNMNKNKLRKLLKITLYQSIDEHENKFILYANKNPNENSKVAKTIIRKFNETHANTIEAQIETIDAIFENDNLKRSNYELIYNILNIHHTLIINLIINSNKIFKHLNGELDGLTYKGYTIEKINHE